MLLGICKASFPQSEQWLLIVLTVKSIIFHSFRESPRMQNSTLVKLGVRKEKDTLQPESDLLSGK